MLTEVAKRASNLAKISRWACTGKVEELLDGGMGIDCVGVPEEDLKALVADGWTWDCETADDNAICLKYWFG